jgi:hypothetical protein
MTCHPSTSLTAEMFYGETTGRLLQSPLTAAVLPKALV